MQNKPRRLGSDVYTCEYKSAVAVCEACTIETEAQKAHALRLLCQRFTPNSMDGAQMATNMSLKVTNCYKFKILELSSKQKIVK